MTRRELLDSIDSALRGEDRAHNLRMRLFCGLREVITT